jgi:hypothetical protein
VIFEEINIKCRTYSRSDSCYRWPKNGTISFTVFYFLKEELELDGIIGQSKLVFI